MGPPAQTRSCSGSFCDRFSSHGYPSKNRPASPLLDLRRGPGPDLPAGHLRPGGPRLGPRRPGRRPLRLFPEQLDGGRPARLFKGNAHHAGRPIAARRAGAGDDPIRRPSGRAEPAPIQDPPGRLAPDRPDRGGRGGHPLRIPHLGLAPPRLARHRGGLRLSVPRRELRQLDPGADPERREVAGQGVRAHPELGGRKGIRRRRGSPSRQNLFLDGQGNRPHLVPSPGAGRSRGGFRRFPFQSPAGGPRGGAASQ
jgi:hypothetical protein